MWRGGHGAGRYLLLALTLAAVGCAAPASGNATPSTGPNPVDETTTEAPGTTRAAGDCDIPAGQPFIESDIVPVPVIGEVDGVTVSAALYPHPDYEGEPWSQWGQGIVTDDGRFFSAIGDHGAIDGNSYVYEYDPATSELTMVADVLSYIDHVPGTWGHGKIHSQMVAGPCEEIYFSTYWGSFRDIEFTGNYTGELLFRLDPFGRTLAPVGVPIDHHGQASLAADPSSGMIYGEAVDPVPMSDDIETGPFFAYDVAGEEVVFTGPDQPHVGFRSIMVDADGVAYWSIGDGKLQTYDPATGESATHPDTLPGYWLRAVTRPAADGSIYGVTRDPDTFFVMRPDGSIDELGPALEYTASMALSPDDSLFYYMPGAHGDAPQWGSPLIAVNTVTGEQTTVVELNDLVEAELGYTVGGTFDLRITPDGSTIYLGANVAEVGSEEEFGEVLLLVIDLP